MDKRPVGVSAALYPPRILPVARQIGRGIEALSLFQDPATHSVFNPVTHSLSLPRLLSFSFLFSIPAHFVPPLLFLADFLVWTILALLDP